MAILDVLNPVKIKMKASQTTLLESSPAIETPAIETASPQTPAIDLTELKNQIATSAKGLQKIVLETGKPALIAVSSILKKLPDLEALPPNLNLFRIRYNGTFEGDTLNVYNLDGKTVLASPDLEVLDGFEFLSFKTGISGYCEVSFNGLTLRINISVSDNHLETVAENGGKGVDGFGKPDPSYLRDFPQPETPLHSDELPQNTTLTVIAIGKVSKKYQTPLVDVQTAKGVIFKNVITNSQLENIVATHGLGSKFKIVGKKQVTDKADKKTFKVQLQDMQGLDFSDL